MSASVCASFSTCALVWSFSREAVPYTVSAITTECLSGGMIRVCVCDHGGLLIVWYDLWAGEGPGLTGLCLMTPILDHDQEGRFGGSPCWCHSEKCK